MSLRLAWLALDLPVGIGTPAILLLTAVLRRTRRLLRATVAALFLSALLPLISYAAPPRLTHRRDPWPPSAPGHAGDGVTRPSVRPPV
uniref:Uncharacterized protein n=1 Tax=Nonomuraea gerenzanensis TaxID=93944 RepID=A0A1M4EHP6_9ACTN|nr:hypothetical protein BN4615_P7838 [Nonomuraea gerenzanensis]